MKGKIVLIVLCFICCVSSGYVIYDVFFSDEKCVDNTSQKDNDIDNSNEVNGDNINEDNQSDESSDNDDNVKNEEEFFSTDASYFNLSGIDYVTLNPKFSPIETKEPVVIEDKSVIKSLLSNFGKMTFKSFVPASIGLGEESIMITYFDNSTISIVSVCSSTNEIVILDRRQKDYENKPVINSVHLILANNISFNEIFQQYYK